jgi:hypothetical protein
MQSLCVRYEILVSGMLHNKTETISDERSFENILYTAENIDNGPKLQLLAVPSN